MSETLPTASGLDRAIACDLSNVGPRVNVSSKWAERGTACHLVLEKYANGIPIDIAISQAEPEYQEWLRLIDYDALFVDVTPGDWIVETSCAIDVDSWKVRWYRKPGERDYGSLSENEFAGTLDFGYVSKKTGRPVLRDYKTGLDLGDPRSKYQLRFFGLGSWLTDAPPEIDVEFVYIGDDGSVRIQRTEMPLLSADHVETQNTLRGLRNRIRELQSRPAGRPSVTATPGSHCRYCPVFQQCPAKLGLLKQVVPHVRFVADSIQFMGPSEIGHAWLQKQEIDRLLEDVNGIFSEYIAENDVPLGNGKKLVMGTASRASWDKDALIRLARSKGATESQIRSCLKPNTFNRITVKNI